jgi:asparagine synthase (glutamine-hydrolysing)
VGGWIASGGEALARQIAAQPGVAAIVPEAVVLGVVANAARDSQPAWSLLYYALWHSHHVLGVDSSADVATVLAESAR